MLQTKTLLTTALGLALTTALASESHAITLVYDGFGPTEIGFEAANWDPFKSASGLSYPGVTTEAGSFQSSTPSGGSPDTRDTSRALDTTLSTADQDLYFGFLGAGFNNSTETWKFQLDNADVLTFSFIGNNGGPVTINYDGQSDAGGNGPQRVGSLRPGFILLELLYDSISDATTINMWAGNTNGSTLDFDNLGAPDASITGADNSGALSFNGFALDSSGNQSGNWNGQFDEIRVGTDIDSVVETIIPEPASLALLAVGSLCIFVRPRH